jgi:hypothetical protein
MTGIDRIPLAHSVRYVAHGLPEVPNHYGPGVLAPSEITLTYRAAPDSQLGRVHAYVAGRLWVDGKEVPLQPGGLYGQHYLDGLDNWPEWLAEEARLHDPEAAAVSAAVAPPTDPTHGLSVPHADALWDAVAIPGPHTPTYPEQHERVCRAVRDIIDELTPAPDEPADEGVYASRAAEAELYVLLRKAGEDRHEAQALIDRHRDEVLRRAAVLPEPAPTTNRADVQDALRRATEAEAKTERYNRAAVSAAALSHAANEKLRCNNAWLSDRARELEQRAERAEAELRRLADETATETPAAEPTAEDIARAHVTSLHLIGEQLATIEGWFWEHLANVRAADGPAAGARQDGAET